MRARWAPRGDRPLQASLVLNPAGSARHVSLADYLDADLEEQAAIQANAWIKSIRAARVDGMPFRERFTYTGDSLWWFAELYLHKERAVLALFRTLLAANALLDRESPSAVRLLSGDETARLILPQLARTRRIPWEGEGARQSYAAPVAMDARSTSLMLAAVASPARPFRLPPRVRTTLAAFVHTAFWRGDSDQSAAESYIGPVLQELEGRVGVQGLAYLGVGPTSNFRARRWWKPGPAPARAVRPIETLVPRFALAGSLGLWLARHHVRRALQSSPDLRAAAVLGGCDCWPVVARSLSGVALLQFPWSARAMDEAGVALDVLEPAAALTYAEAGGWGRALALEARRRGIPLAGLQHGFIYRHWLNYLHESDEMHPPGAGSRDRGFPLPARTLVFDEYAALHLIEAGRFPPESIVVTGSPRLDGLARRFAELDPDKVQAVRRLAGADDSRHLVLLVTKFSEVHGVLPALLDAVGSIEGTQLAIKTHPAETPGPYETAAAGMRRVRVLPAGTDLAALLRASRAVVTVNSTVALDAAALGVPALTIGMPNNLSPFVSAGALAGAAGPQEIADVLRRLLYDGRFRLRLSAASMSLTAEYRMIPDGRAAERQADAILGLAGPQP